MTVKWLLRKILIFNVFNQFRKTFKGKCASVNHEWWHLYIYYPCECTLMHRINSSRNINEYHIRANVQKIRRNCIHAKTSENKQICTMNNLIWFIYERSKILTNIDQFYWCRTNKLHKLNKKKLTILFSLNDVTDPKSAKIDKSIHFLHWKWYFIDSLVWYRGD